MNLHNYSDIFFKYIEQVAKKYNVAPALIEKDYFAFLLLSELNKAIPGLLFKGGTCLSSAFHIIDRFSEDIDLTLDNNHYGRAKNTNANHKVFEVCDKLGFVVINKEKAKLRSHASFNRYLIEYPFHYLNDAIKKTIQVEMVFLQKSYPSETKKANSLIGYSLEKLNNDESKKYELESFDINVQSLERTFVDKVFAICDYFERNETRRNSRHLYDLYKICDSINLNSDDMINLIKSVREDRKKSYRAVSARDGYSINDTLLRIKDTNFYKEDFEKITTQMLFIKVGYDEIVTVLDKIIESKAFIS